nr:uncharacterized protein LOC105847494 [Hydra vulgaris]
MISTLNHRETNSIQDNEVCRHLFYTVATGNNVTIFTVLCAINILFILISNVAVAFGLIYSKGKKSYTRNEKLVFLLSCSDVLVALIHEPLQIILVKNLKTLGCALISARGFWHVFLLLFSGSIVLLISIEQYIAVFYNNRIWGFYVKEIYLVSGIVFYFIASMMFSLWYAIDIVRSTNVYRMSIFFFSVATYTTFILTAVIIVNTTLLRSTLKRLGECNIRVHKKNQIERRLTVTIMFISITLVVTYAPSVITNFYTAIIASKDNKSDLQNVIKPFMWTLFVCELNSAFNALIYIGRNKKIKKMYALLFNQIVKCKKRKQ